MSATRQAVGLNLKLSDVEGGCLLPVRVHPGAKRDAITGVHDGALKVSLAAPAVDGRANQALIAFIARRLGLLRSRIEILRGANSRSKTIRIASKSAADLLAALAGSND